MYIGVYYTAILILLGCFLFGSRPVIYINVMQYNLFKLDRGCQSVKTYSSE